MHDVIQNLGLKNREMDKLIEEFSHSIYGLNFQLSYEIVFSVKQNVHDANRSNLTTPVIIHPKPEIIVFSNKRVYLSQPDERSLVYPDLELPQPIFEKFKPQLMPDVKLKDDPTKNTAKYYNDITKIFEQPTTTLCKY